MSASNIKPNDYKNHKVSVFEPFSAFLQGSEEESQFQISLLDVVRFAGHACPSIVGAFLISQRAIKELFPVTETCVRGEIAIDIPTGPTQGATGPISNVFSFIFGAWSDTGFGGLQGQFARRGLIRYSVPGIPPGCFRFKNLKTGAQVDITYNPSLAVVEVRDGEAFQQQWQRKIKAILEKPEAVLSSLGGA